MKKPVLSFWQIWNMSFGFLGIQIGFGLQGANVSRIFQNLGASIDDLAILWIAGPVTGFLVQPIVGYFSDRTWTRFGRRRPYFFAGAVLTSIALIYMPNAPVLWMAAATLWILDASISISMEPFRAFVGDMLPRRQRTRGFSMQTIFIGCGAFLASLAPWYLANVMDVSNVAPEGIIPDSVKYSFYIGGIALFLAIFWTIITTKEYSPSQITAFEEHDEDERDVKNNVTLPPIKFYVDYGLLATIVAAIFATIIYIFEGDKQLYVLAGMIGFLGFSFLSQAVMIRLKCKENFFNTIISDLCTMPKVMGQLAVVQFFSWFGLFILWIYSTPAVTSFHFGADDPTSALFNEGANWVGIMFAIYNIVAAIYALALPWLSKKLGRRKLHALNLLIGALGLMSYVIFQDPMLLLLSMVGVGIAWASILTIPYSILSNDVPIKKMGIYMGIFNFFIGIPQLVVTGVMGPVIREFLQGKAIYAIVLGGLSLVFAAISLAFVKPSVDAEGVIRSIPSDTLETEPC